MMPKRKSKKKSFVSDNSHIIKWYFSKSGQVPLLTILFTSQNYFDLFLAHCEFVFNFFILWFKVFLRLAHNLA